MQKLSKQQITELQAAKIFIKFLGINHKNEDFKFPDQADSIDVIYVPNNLKFQVTSFDGGPSKLLNNGRYEYSIKLDKIIEEYFTKPTDKKTSKYQAHGVEDVILLIHGIVKPGRSNMLEKDIKEQSSKINDMATKSGFKAIYFVFDMNDEVVLLYKR